MSAEDYTKKQKEEMAKSLSTETARSEQMDARERSQAQAVPAERAAAAQNGVADAAAGGSGASAAQGTVLADDPGYALLAQQGSGNIAVDSEPAAQTLVDERQEQTRAELAENADALAAAAQQYSAALSSFENADAAYTQYQSEVPGRRELPFGTFDGLAGVKRRHEAAALQTAYDEYERADTAYVLSLAKVKAQTRSKEEIEAERAGLEKLEQTDDVAGRLRQLDEEFGWWMYFTYDTLRENGDFEANSKYVTTRRSDAYTSGYDDIFYDIINGDERALHRQLASELGTGAYNYGNDSSYLTQLTEDEVEVFNYIYKKQGREAAYGYINDLRPELNARQRAAEEDEWREFADEHPVLGSAFSVMEAPLRATDYISQLADYTINGKIDENAAYNRHSYTSTAIREEVSEKVERSWGRLGSTAYNVGMSFADYLFTTAACGGNVNLAAAVLGAGSAADTVLDAKDRGLSDGQAFALGTAAGVTECVFSRLDLGVLFKGKWEKGAVRYILKNAGVDGGSSVAEELVNSIADTLIARDKSYWKQKLTEYEAVYGSEAEAFAHALSDELLRYGGIFLSGAAGGAAMAAGRTAIGYAANRFGGKGQAELPEGDAARAKEQPYGDWADDKTPDGKTRFDAGDVETDEVSVESDGEMHKSGGVAVAEKGETENGSTIDENRLYSPEPDDINADIYQSMPFFEGELIDDELMQRLEASGVKYSKDKVLMTAKKPNGDLQWLEVGNNNAGMIHTELRHGDDLRRKGIPTDKIPNFMKYIIQELDPYKVGTNDAGPYADYYVNGDIYRLSHGTNGFIVTLYPNSSNKK